MFSEHTRFCAAVRIVVRTIGGESLLLPISGAAAGDFVYPLNDTAKVVWESINANQTLGEIAAELTRRFDVDQEKANADCRNLIDMLHAEGLIAPVTRNDPPLGNEPAAREPGMKLMGNSTS